MKLHWLGLFVVLTACAPNENALPVACRVDGDCNPGRVCRESRCISAPDAGLPDTTVSEVGPDIIRDYDVDPVEVPAPDDAGAGGETSPPPKDAAWQGETKDGPSPDPIPAACYEAARALVATESQTKLRAWIVGRWHRCGGFGFRNAQSNEVVEFAADGSWRFWRWAAGRFTPTSGFRAGGTWHLGDGAPGDLRVYFTFTEGDGGSFRPVFQANKHRMLTLEGGEAVDESVWMPDNSYPQCEGVGEVVSWNDVAEVPAAVAGKWIRCGGGEPANLAGEPFELTADGRYYRLHEGIQGLTRMAGVGGGGSYTITRYNDSPSGPFTTANLTLVPDGIPSSLSSNLALTRNPVRLTFGPTVYVPVP